MHLPVKNESKLAVEIPPEVADVFSLQRNLEGITVPRLPQIKIIHRGQMFEMPDASKPDTFEGIILDQHAANAWWEKPMSESTGNERPDCWSMDGIIPEESEKRQSEKCADCPQNEYGSDPTPGSDGKACKNMKRLLVLMEDSLLPRRFTIPPSSIATFEIYTSNDIYDVGLDYALVESQFFLEKRTKGSFEYSIVRIKMNRILKYDEILQVGKCIQEYKSARQQEIRAEEYVQDETFEPEDLDKDIPY
jgi:hypothetical protein